MDITKSSVEEKEDMAGRVVYHVHEVQRGLEHDC